MATDLRRPAKPVSVHVVVTLDPAETTPSKRQRRGAPTPPRAADLHQISIAYIEGGFLVTCEPQRMVDGGARSSVRPRTYRFTDPHKVLAFVSQVVLGE